MAMTRRVHRSGSARDCPLRAANALTSPFAASASSPKWTGTPFECATCRKKQGFDRDDPVPNRLLCSMLTKRQEPPTPAVLEKVSETKPKRPRLEGQEEVATTFSPRSSVVQTRCAPTKLASPPVKEERTSTRTTSDIRPAQRPKRRASTETKNNPSKNALPSNTNGRKRTRASRRGTANTTNAASPPADYAVGQLVYCEWLPNKQFYWGRIVQLYPAKNKNELATYKVEFEIDGDVRDNVPRDELLTEEEC